MKKMIAIAATGLLALTACGGGGSDATDEPVSGQNNVSEGQPTPQAPKPSQDGLKLGEAFTGKVSKETVVSYHHEDTEELADQAAGRIDYFVLQTCAVAEEVTPSGSSWKVADTDGGFYDVGFARDMPKPNYPQGDVTLQPGDCAKGTLAFDVPVGVKLAKIVYSSEGLGNAEWAVEEPKPTPKPTFEFAVTKKLNTTMVKFTPLQYRPRVTTNGGHRIDGFQVKACVGEVPGVGKAQLGFGNWGFKTAAGKDDSVSGYDFLKPVYPNGKVYKTGACVTGWFFAEVVKADDTITHLTYDNDEGITAEWSIKQK